MKKGFGFFVLLFLLVCLPATCLLNDRAEIRKSDGSSVFLQIWKRSFSDDSHFITRYNAAKDRKTVNLPKNLVARIKTKFVNKF